MWIEIFRTGKHRDSIGREADYPIETLDKIVSKFNTSSEDGSYSAPLVIGHPSTNEPAHGWVERLSRRKSVLLAKLKDLSNEIIEDVRQGKYKKISIALDSNLLLRHVGLLGAAQPAVQGLKPVTFSEDGSELHYFEEALNLQNDDIFQNIAKLEEENIALKNEIQSLKNSIKQRQFSDYANDYFARNKFIAADEQVIEKLTDLLIKADCAAAQNSEFSESQELVGDIKQFFDALKPAHLFETLHSNYSNQNNSDNFSGRKVNQTRLELHKNAIAYIAENPEMTYQQAINHLQKT